MKSFISDRPFAVFVAKNAEGLGEYRTHYVPISLLEAGKYLYQVPDDLDEVPESAGVPVAAWHLYDYKKKQWIERDLPEDWQGVPSIDQEYR